MTNHGLPRFSDCEFHTAYPFGQVTLADAKVPLDVRLEAFNPLIPGHADDSGIPVAVLRFVLTNPGSAPVEAAVCGGLENFSGTDGLYGLPERTFNELREDGEIRGVFMQSTGVAKTAEQWGTMALTATATATAKDITYRAAWPVRSWGDALLGFWDDFANDGRLEGRDGGQDPDARAMASRGAVLALTGFQYSGVERSIAFAARPGVHFWSNGEAWGVCRQNVEEGTAAVELEVLSGSLELARFALHGMGGIAFDEPAAIAERETLSLIVCVVGPGPNRRGAAGRLG